MAIGIPAEVEAAGVPAELLKVMARFAHHKPEKNRAWMRTVYALSDGARAVYQATNGWRMVRANYPTTLAPGAYDALTLAHAEWPAAFGDFDRIAGAIDKKAKGPWGFDPALFDFKEIADALAKAEARISGDRKPKARERAALHYRVQITLGGELDPMLAKIGPVEVL